MRHAIPFILLTLCASACVHSRPPLAKPSPVPGSPGADAILADLTKADRNLANFSSNGEIWMRLPGEEAIQNFDPCHVRFLRPAQFYADAKKVGQGVRVYINGDTFLLELPSKNTFYFGREGDHFDDVALDIAPSMLFRELFLAETLSRLDTGQVELLSYDAAGQRAELAVYQGARHRVLERRLTAESGPDGWYVTESLLMDGTGGIECQTECKDYGHLDGVYLPQWIEVNFPGSGAMMRFKLRPQLLKANRAAPREVDDVNAVRAALLAKGCQEVRGVPAEGGGR